MRLAVDLSFFVADQRGMGRVVRCLLRELLAATADEWLFFVRKPEEISQVEKWLREVNPTLPAKTILVRDLPRQAVDVCWYPWNRVDARPKAGCRIVTINDVNPFVYPYRSLWRWWDQRKDENRFRRAARLADRIVTISEFSRQEIMRYLGVDAKKIQVMPLGVDSNWFSPPVATRTGGTTAPRLLYVGSDDERKNLRRLLEAMVLLHRQMECRATLTCCGLGDAAAAKYSPLLKDAEIADFVTFTGFLPDEELQTLYTETDLFVFPSLYEGFGLPILEAMAAGLPVVSSRSASLPEVGGEAAVYCDATDPAELATAIREIWCNPTLREQLMKDGSERAARFTWTRAAQAWREIITAKEQ